MRIHEVCKACSLTKKAIEYYIGQGLVFPSVSDNGYRDFSDEDVLALKKISVLRNLGLSAAEIRGVLSDGSLAALDEIYHRKAMQISVLREKQELVRELAAKHDWEEIQDRLRQLQERQTVLERLMNAFPGSYGRCLCLHFAPYLKEPILTEVQRGAFDRIVSFLDKVDFDIPDDLKKYLDGINFDEGLVENISENMNAMISETEKFITDHREMLEGYIAYKRSEEYKASPAYHLEEALRRFNCASGYNEIFILAMCQLSESYRRYYEGLQKADETFAQSMKIF